jgi:NTE family protein
MKKHKKIGLALGSGGARGLVHLGVIKTLVKNNIPIDYIAGTSIGACVGAMYAAHQDIEKVEAIMLGDKWNAFLCFLDPAFLKGGIISGKRLEKLLKNWIGVKNFKDLATPLTTVATDLITGREIQQTKGKLIPAVHASMAIPSLFKPIPYKQQLLVDGGLVNPVPDNAVRDMGADIVIAVNLDHKNEIKNRKGEAKKYKFSNQVLIRSFHIIRHYLADHCIQTADITLAPPLNENGLLSLNAYFTKKRAHELIKIA